MSFYLFILIIYFIIFPPYFVGISGPEKEFHIKDKFA